MSSSNPISKATSQRHQRILLDLLKQAGNDICADCRTRNPRWASWNLGIFICVKCAGIHRKMGTHISKVKSLTLDSWTKEQIEKMKSLGNLKVNRYYNPNEAKNPPPTDLEESERDSQLEKYIRMKYESRRFLDLTVSDTSSSGHGSISTDTGSRIVHSPNLSPASSILQHSSHTPLPSPFGSYINNTIVSPTNQHPIKTNSLPFNHSARAGSQTSMPSKVPNSSVFSSPSTTAASKNAQISHNLTPSVYFPPSRPSTAPIPSDPLSHTQPAPPLPSLPTLYSEPNLNWSSGSSHTIWPPPTIGSKNSSALNPPPNKLPPQFQKGGIWDDLMQLTEPALHQPQNNNTTLTSSNSSSAITPRWNSIIPSSSQLPTSLSSGNLLANSAAIGAPINQATPGPGYNYPNHTINPFMQIQAPNVSTMSQSNLPMATYPVSNIFPDKQTSNNPFCDHDASSLATSKLLSTNNVNYSANHHRNPFLAQNGVMMHGGMSNFESLYPSTAQQQQYPKAQPIQFSMNPDVSSQEQNHLAFFR
ncbi:hypothetical protein O181_035198 [Austropuccinia psidii MF-1]|uniref:Arf-GAP domain-containing protein n=1 Tax=Austropuccinia psidii MF-1 TaxID=1389203 RepID=A0A9Q3D501_9BASI|nr:hypothetical protein [Austropuccinia psidii MF-1]